jgi:hypothetical protein
MTSPEQRQGQKVNAWRARYRETGPAASKEGGGEDPKGHRALPLSYLARFVPLYDLEPVVSESTAALRSLLGCGLATWRRGFWGADLREGWPGQMSALPNALF